MNTSSISESELAEVKKQLFFYFVFYLMFFGFCVFTAFLASEFKDPIDPALAVIFGLLTLRMDSQRQYLRIKYSL